MTQRKKVLVLGSTGSIGTQTLDVARKHPGKLQIVGLAAGRRASELLAQAQEFDVRALALGDCSSDAEGLQIGRAHV